MEAGEGPDGSGHEHDYGEVGYDGALTCPVCRTTCVRIKIGCLTCTRAAFALLWIHLLADHRGIVQAELDERARLSN